MYYFLNTLEVCKKIRLISREDYFCFFYVFFGGGGVGVGR